MDNPVIFRLVNSLVQVTILVLMFSIGIRLEIPQATYLLKHPKRLILSLLSVDLLWPIVAMAIVLMMPISNPARIALALIVSCPGAPLTTRRVEQATGSVTYGASLQLTVSLLAVLTVPLTLSIVFSLLPPNIFPSPGLIARQVATVQFIPICLGLIIRRYVPKLGERLARPSVKLGNILFWVMVAILLTQVFNVILLLNPVLVATIVLMAGIGLAIGHYLGGPDLESRKSLAIGTIARNAGLAIYLANIDFSELNLLPTILAYLILSFLSEAIYKRLTRAIPRSI